MKHNIELDNYVSTQRLLDKLIGSLIEPELIEPTFLMHHPLAMSPLAKEHRSIPGQGMKSVSVSTNAMKYIGFIKTQRFKDQF